MRVALSRAIPQDSTQGLTGQGLHGWSFGYVLLALDVVALCLAAALASQVTLGLEALFDRLPYTAQAGVTTAHQRIFSMLCLSILALFWGKGAYTERLPWWSQVQYTARIVFFMFLFDVFISYTLKIYESRMLIGFSWLFAFSFMVLLRWLGCKWARRLGLWSIPTVVIGDHATVTDVLYAFTADPCAGYDVRMAFLRDRNGGFDLRDLPRECRNLHVRDDLSDYGDFIRRNPSYFYVIALDAFRGEARDDLIREIEQAGARFAVVPSIGHTGLYQMEPRYFFGQDVMLLQARRVAERRPFSPSRALKRAMDIAVSGLALLVLLPVFAAVALLLKIEGQGGSIFYDGRRIGYRGHSFRCWKFRSMEPDSDYLLHAYLEANPAAKADWEKYRKLPADPRVTTRTARFIRKASIDELPQLWNVLRGDMSLVGPRPILEDEKAYFGETLQNYLSVRPGLTGLWQVSGRNATSFVRRVYWDNWYVRNWSLWGDIIILIKTPLVLLSRKGAS